MKIAREKKKPAAILGSMRVLSKVVTGATPRSFDVGTAKYVSALEEHLVINCIHYFRRRISNIRSLFARLRSSPSRISTEGVLNVAKIREIFAKYSSSANVHQLSAQNTALMRSVRQFMRTEMSTNYYVSTGRRKNEEKPRQRHIIVISASN